MQEEWCVIDEFPDYSVSNHGRVVSGHYGKLLTHSLNQRGFPTVGMVLDGKQYRRSIAALVAKAFIPMPNYRFDTPTPINLDGDRLNNHVDNLAWRPRWFAIEYQQQFTGVDKAWLNLPVYLRTTDELFDRAIDCCTKYGLLVRNVVMAAHNGTPVFPEGYEFDLVSENIPSRS